GGRPKQLVEALVAQKLSPQDGLVGGVLQQAPDEISHAGDQISDRCVDPQAIAGVHDGSLQRLGHPVPQLELYDLRCDPAPIGVPLASAQASSSRTSRSVSLRYACSARLARG